MQPKLAAVLLSSLTIFFVWRRLTRRVSKLPRSQERVLILGASSGVGKELAVQYANRGAKVCLVGRGEVQLQDVVNLCLKASQALPAGQPVISLAADFTNPEDLIRVRDAIQKGEHFEALLFLSSSKSRVEWLRHRLGLRWCICSAAHS